MLSKGTAGNAPFVLFMNHVTDNEGSDAVGVYSQLPRAIPAMLVVYTASITLKRA
jgi:hypothetical protein